ncbi:MAG: transposase [Stellaceae bacterium]
MARIARFVVPGLPHHVTQRGNRRERVFFSDDDYRVYRDLLREACDKAGVSVWAYCLMPNHVHLILTPTTVDGLARALGKAHRRYSAFVNARLRVTGHLFQSRFGSVVMDEDHLMAAGRYVALNPVRARLAERAQDWPWSSVRAHLEGRNDSLVEVAPLLARAAGRFADLLDDEPDAEKVAALRVAEGIGRPLGSEAFLDRVAGLMSRNPRRGKPGRKPKPAAAEVI